MSGGPEEDGGGAAVAVAVKSCGGRGSNRAVLWAAEKMVGPIHRVLLLHVMPTITSIPTPSGEKTPVEDLDPKIVRLYVHDTKENCKNMFVPFKKLFRKRKVDILVLEGDDPASTLLSYISDSGISALVVGSCSSTHTCLKRKPKSSLVPSVLLKNAPLSCNVTAVYRYGVTKNTSRPLLENANGCSKEFLLTEGGNDYQMDRGLPLVGSSSVQSRMYTYLELSSTSDLSGHTSMQHNHQSAGKNILDSEADENRSETSAYSKQSNVEVEVEQLRQEIHGMLSMYNRTCEDLIYTQKKVKLLSLECLEEETRLDAAKQREENLRKVAAQEKEKHLEAIQEVEMAKDQCAKEVSERHIAEANAIKEFSERQKIVEALFSNDKRYRRYSINEIEEATGFFSGEKVIGSGAYGKVYKCILDHTPVAIKILQSDASHKKEEFLKEVEVLSLLRHPHVVLLLGACPELGCLVYEFMENGSLEDHILGKTGSPLPWVIRFRIVYEVACGLAFLHNSGPEPIVHRDLKPGNVLLGKNYVSKIGDVGLAKMISDVVPDNVTEYRNSVIAGTLCYMDPEYQRTGTLRPKSDVYALGVIALQLLTASSPSGIIHKVEKAMKTGSFFDVLDTSVSNWPLAEVVELAQMALKCCKLKCRDRPDLETEVLPVLKRLAGFADATRKGDTGKVPAPSHYYCPILQDIMDEPYIAADGFTYERIAIKVWLERSNISPVTKRKMSNNALTPNHMLSSAIQEWRARFLSSQR